jgi:hypothetical protein
MGNVDGAVFIVFGVLKGRDILTPSFGSLDKLLHPYSILWCTATTNAIVEVGCILLSCLIRGC